MTTDRGGDATSAENKPANPRSLAKLPDTPHRTRSRRDALGVALGGLAVFTRLGAADAAPIGRSKPSRRRPKSRPQRRRRVVTRTFTNPTPIVIRSKAPAQPYPSAITVRGLPRGKLLDVNVRLNRYTHTWTTDVDLMLVAPNGRSAVLMSDVGDADVDNLTLILDDQGASSFETEELRSGSFKPANLESSQQDDFPPPAAASPNVALSTFTGINPNGIWKLYVVDDSNLDEGAILGGWSLIIKARARV